jgi:hypothetical protein
MNIIQPKYITYKGARYERVNTLNEIIVEPANRCCIITIIGAGDSVIKEFKISKNPEKIADSALSEAKQRFYRSAKPSEYEMVARYIEEFFSKKPEKIDRYSYYADLGEEDFFMVCTKDEGKWSFLYDLAKNNDDDGIINTAPPLNL